MQLLAQKRLQKEEAISNKNFNNHHTHVIEDDSISHEVYKNLNFLKIFGVTDFLDHLEVWTSPENYAFIEKLLNISLSNNGIVTLSLGTTVKNQSLDVNSWLGIISLLNKLINAQIIMIGGEKEKILSDTIQQRTKIINMVGKLSLNQSATLLRHSALSICLDSSMKHISAAVQTPTIELVAHSKQIPSSSPHSLLRFGFWGNKCTTIHPIENLDPCNSLQCTHSSPHCILNIDWNTLENTIQSFQ